MKGLPRILVAKVQSKYNYRSFKPENSVIWIFRHFLFLNSLIKVGEIIKKSYNENNNYIINYKFFTVPLERTSLMLKRLEYLANKQGIKGMEDVYVLFKDIYQLYNVLLSMVIKSNIIDDKSNIIEKICEGIVSVTKNEKLAFEMLLEKLN